MKIVKVISVILLMGVMNKPVIAGTLDNIKERGFLKCGVNTGLLGFSIKNDNGRWEGFDVEFCRALAVAIFNDPEKVEYRGLNGSERFKVLSDGEVDILYRNTTWTLTRDSAMGITFAGVNYYDGQGYMVKSDAGINSAYELSGLRLCTEEGTTGVTNSIDFFNFNNMKYEIVSYETSAGVRDGFQQGECDVISNDQSALYSQRLNLEDPSSVVILPELISKEPLGPSVKRGDDEWFDIAHWVLNMMIEAEFLDINSVNAVSLRESGSMEQKRLLALGHLPVVETDEKPEETLTAELGTHEIDLNLEAGWAYRVITQIGNYGEVFKRTIGAQSELQIARGLNAQWNNGGILYSQSFR